MSHFSFLHRQKLHLRWHWQWRLANKPKELLPGTCRREACWRSVGRSHRLPLFHAEFLLGFLRTHLWLCPSQGIFSVLQETKALVANLHFFKLSDWHLSPNVFGFCPIWCRRLFSRHVCDVSIHLFKTAIEFVAKNGNQSLYTAIDYLWFAPCILCPKLFIYSRF